MTRQSGGYPLKTALFVGIVLLTGAVLVVSIVRRQLAENAEPIPAAPARSATSAPLAGTPAQTPANPSDLQQAKDYLAALPLACAGSSYSAEADGTVNVRTICRSATSEVDGLISIKNGVVTQVR